MILLPLTPKCLVSAALNGELNVQRGLSPRTSERSGTKVIFTLSIGIERDFPNRSCHSWVFLQGVKEQRLKRAVSWKEGSQVPQAGGNVPHPLQGQVREDGVSFLFLGAPPGVYIQRLPFLRRLDLPLEGCGVKMGVQARDPV
jgi:hypothetical protein